MSLRSLRKLLSRFLTNAPARPSLDRRRSRSGRPPCLEVLEDRTAPATFTVMNTLDSGVASLRQAILDSNASSDPSNIIQFAIPGGGVHTINLLSALPNIAHPVLIDGYTELGSSPNTLAVGDNAVLTIELNGAVAGPSANGLSIIAANTTVRGLVINRFNQAGIVVTGPTASGDTIAGNFIGTNAAGVTAMANGQNGIDIASGAMNNTIGGVTAAARNLISGNQVTGIFISGTGVTGNIVAGNYIGTAGSGTATIADGNVGIVISAGATNNTIGGLTSAARNLISGNQSFGIYISSDGNMVAGNYVGTDVNGTTALANRNNGIILYGSGNTIGGTTRAAGNLISGNDGYGIQIDSNDNLVAGNYIGTNVTATGALANARDGIFMDGASRNVVGGIMAAARNIISGNRGNGVAILGTGSTANLIQGNYIGTDGTGTHALGNGGAGVGVHLGASNNLIGGTTAGASNLLSGNLAGVFLGGGAPDVSGNVVAGNYIGTDVTGTATLTGQQEGIFITSGATNNTIGGTVAGARNLISGNQFTGIQIEESGGNVVEGNYIGTNAAGTASLGNGDLGNGISLFASNNRIGGTAPGSGNLISGNQADGVFINGPGNVVQGNYIGTDVTGTKIVANAYGILVYDPNNTIGGTTATARNLISGNVQCGISIIGASNHATNNVVEGNYIGTNTTGTDPLANGVGVRVGVGATNIIIGGIATGAGNLISGNQGHRIEITGSGTTGNLVQGNYIGTDVTGTHLLGNGVDGVSLAGGASANSVGGTAPGARNVIAGNGGSGISILNNQGNVVQGNYIGTDVSGTVPLGNGFAGVTITDNASNNMIGGTVTAAGNVISGNAFYGIIIQPSGATGNLIQGNLIGTMADGTSPLGNGTIGVSIGAPGNTVGGTVAGVRNVISGNGGFGLDLFGSQASGNLVQGNFVGTNANGTAALANGADGMLLNGGSHDNSIGGTAAGAGNIIAGNAGAGIELTDGASSNIVQGNYIGTDASGIVALGNGIEGVLINGGASNNTIGGTATAAGNVISGNVRNGVAIDIGGGAGNLIQGNFIGTTADGMSALGNGAIGVTIGAPGNTVGGTVAGARNVISGNRGIGLDLFGSAASGNVVQGNFIGTDATGTAALGNGSDGILLNGGDNNTIGGTALGAGNVIAGNAGNGILLYDSNTTANLLQGNLIGTDVSATLNLGNSGNGVAIVFGAHDNTIGGMADGAGNVIAFNGNDGVLIDTGTGNAISQNSIFGNANLGIELLNGGNNDQAAPQLASAVAGGGVTTAQGTFTGQALTTYTLEFFAADSSGQGQTFLGRVTVTTDETGVAIFTFNYGSELPLGQLVTATATDPANNTSAFSQTVAVAS
jgi:parallel beta-helix repeat protein